jgi:hypothetical protein
MLYPQRLSSICQSGAVYYHDSFTAIAREAHVAVAQVLYLQVQLLADKVKAQGRFVGRVAFVFEIIVPPMFGRYAWLTAPTVA